MKRGWAVLMLVAGCSRHAPPAPEEMALEDYAAADALFAEGKVEEAAPRYASVIRTRERVFDAYLKLAACHETAGRSADAAEVLERLLRVDPSNEDGLRALARLRGRRGEPEAEAGLWRRLLTLRPGDREIEAELARLIGAR